MTKINCLFNTFKYMWQNTRLWLVYIYLTPKMFIRTGDTLLWCGSTPVSTGLAFRLCQLIHNVVAWSGTSWTVPVDILFSLELICKVCVSNRSLSSSLWKSQHVSHFVSSGIYSAFDIEYRHMYHQINLHEAKPSSWVQNYVSP